MRTFTEHVDVFASFVVERGWLMVRNFYQFHIFCLLVMASSMSACQDSEAPRPEKALKKVQETAEQKVHEPIQPLKMPKGLAPERVTLGGRLFHDTRLSIDNSISCASCHDIAAGGDDDLPLFVGVRGAKGGMNSPTVLNSGLSFVQFWNGRVATLEEQAAGPITAAAEMGSNWEHVLSAVKSDPEYVSDFARTYPDGITQDNILNAIAVFERSLVTTGSRFDKWLLGDKKALSKQEVDGYLLFKSAGCVACHQGRNVGGNMFQKFGVIGNYMEDRGNITDADLGRFAITGKESDRFVFKVPSLRNIEHTAPYLHDGSAQTLEEVVHIMGRYQLGRPLTNEEVARLVAFLHTLSGDIPDVSPHQEWVKARLAKQG